MILQEAAKTAVENGVYRITNTATGHVYIGRSKNVGERLRTRIRNASHPDMGVEWFWGIAEAIHEFGVESFEVEILHRDITNPVELDYLETREILEHDCIFPRGYNRTAGNVNGFYKFSLAKSNR